jgi:hypothetical protein
MQRRLDAALRKYHLQHPEEKRRLERLLAEAKQEEAASPQQTPPNQLPEPNP